MFSKYLDPKNDLAFKKIFGEEKHKRIPIAFLNAVFKLEGPDKIVDLDFLNTIQPPEIEARKESIVDVLVRDEKGCRYVIEMQSAKIAGFEKRAQFYAAKTYCAHFNVGGDYIDLKRVIFLALASYVVFPQKKHYKSNHVILDEETHENDLKDFSFTFVELPKFTKEPHELKTIEEQWYYFFKHAEETNDINAVLANNPEIREAYGVLERAQWTESELAAYDQIAMAIADARGAIIAAREEGMEKGMEKKARNSAKNFIRMGLPLNQVALGTELSIEIIQELSEEVKNEDRRN
jgi:predicted transposase/invertase (TIGR01784 family)